MNFAYEWTALLFTWIIRCNVIHLQRFHLNSVQIECQRAYL